MTSNIDNECNLISTSANAVFDLKFVHDSFASSLLDENDIDLTSYLEAYKELRKYETVVKNSSGRPMVLVENGSFLGFKVVDDQTAVELDQMILKILLKNDFPLSKFCSLMGSVFGFVGTEIESKMDVLIDLRQKNDNGYFSTMKKMIQYEIDNNLLKDAKYVSGSRTLLRLHRGLDFIRQFLKRVGELQPDDKTNSIGQEVYNVTLAKYHPWLVRKGAVIAMYVLPTRDILFRRVCGNTIDEALLALPSMLDLTNEVYRRTEDYYKELDLLNLP